MGSLRSIERQSNPSTLGIFWKFIRIKRSITNYLNEAFYGLSHIRSPKTIQIQIQTITQTLLKKKIRIKYNNELIVKYVQKFSVSEHLINELELQRILA